MNLTILLNILTVIAGLIGFLDIMLWEPERRREVLKVSKSGNHKEEQIAMIAKEPAYVELAKFFFPLLLIFVLFRSFSDSVNYGLVLIIAAVVSGIIWLVDKILWEQKRKAALKRLKDSHQDLPQIAYDAVSKDPIIVEYAKAFFPIIVVIVVLRSFLFEPFKIPSGSMKPTLEIGDFVLVNKFSYGIRLPVTHQKILSIGEPKRGEVFVFKFPGNPWEDKDKVEPVDYIKRVIGLPGDTIVYLNRELYIKPACNGAENCPKLQKVPVRLMAKGGYFDTKDKRNLDLYEETINGITHKMLHDPAMSRFNIEDQFWRQCMHAQDEWVVPEGHYFAMGDNREHSADSRFWCFVPEENLVGRASAIWMNWNSNNKFFIDFSRVGEIK